MIGGIWRKKSSAPLVKLLMLQLLLVRVARADEVSTFSELEPAAAVEVRVGVDAAAAAADVGQTQDSEREDDYGGGLIPVYLSERKLRSAIVNLNEDLRQLKRDFIEDATRIYLRVGQHSKVGREAAKRGRIPAIAAHLAGEEFGEILVKKHITERRLLSGLKAAFVKLLPLPTIKRLMASFQSYRWLSGSNHYDLRPRFDADAGQLQFVQIYDVIELRARLRAADDVLSLSSDNIKRILNVAQEFLIENTYSLDTTAPELAALAELLPQMMQYYLNQVVYARANLAKAYEQKLACIGDIAAMAGGERDFLRLVDEIVDTIGLDIDLNSDARGLELPPTINEEIIVNIERKWIPRTMLDSMKEERELLLKQRRHTKRFLQFDGDKYEDDLANWIYQMDETIADRTYN